MKVRELYNILFTEYPGHVGFAPLAVCLAVCGGVVFGGIMLGKAVLAHTPIAETGHS